jgi:hypothetical protein
MKSTFLFCSKSITVGAALVVAAFSLTPNAQAARVAKAVKNTGNATGSYTTARGKSGTFTNSVNRQPGSSARTTTWNPSTGGQGVQTANRTYDKSTGTGTRSSSTTLPNGKSTSSQGTLTKSGNSTNYNGTYTNARGQSGTVTDTRTKTATGYTNDRTVTRPNGQTVTDDRTVTHNPNGTTSIQNTVTGPNGKTASDNLTRTPTANGFNTTGTYTNVQGQSGTINRTGTRTTNPDGSVTNALDTKVTRPNGQTVERDKSVTVNPDGSHP